MERKATDLDRDVRNTWVPIWAMMLVCVICLVLSIVETYRMRGMIQHMQDTVQRSIEKLEASQFKKMK